ncbi:MAG: discoidin domain-containing protein, partial [Steroidobacteraceae bacterium]
AILAAVLLVEGWINVVAASVPERFGPRPPAPDAVVLELPTAHVPDDIAAQFRGVMGGYRTINGYSGYVPRHVFPLQIGLQLRDETVLTEFRRLIPFFVSVLSDDSDGYRSLVTRSQPDARLAVEAVGRSLYFLPKLPRVRHDERGQALAFTVTAASCWSHLMTHVADGRLDTRWACGPAKPGQQIAVDLGAAANVSEVALALGRFTSDAPRRLLIEASEDGATWTAASSGMTAGYAVRAVLEDPLCTEMRIRVSPVRARYIRLTQTGEAWEWYWSVAELAVYGQSDPSS